jgi:hypothetical protein
LDLEKDRAMKNMIIGWGLPQCLKKIESDIDFIFDDKDNIHTYGQHYHCNNGDVKFGIYDKRNRKVLFSMDFFKSGSVISRLDPTHKTGITLQFLYVHDESFRKKRISSFYIERLQEYAIHEKMEGIYVRPIVQRLKQDSKRNTLSQKELEDFYKKRSTKEMPIKLLL